jgi:dephospho-CoA kinase
MWLSYNLPNNVRIETLDSFLSSKPNKNDIVMIRGIRNEYDFEQEKKTLFFNRRNFGIDKFFFLISDSDFAENISSTKVREQAGELRLRDLHQFVSPLVISCLLEKVLQIKNLFMVVGQPGGGKSTFLRLLNRKNPNNVIVETDEFNKSLRPYLEKNFPGQDLHEIVLQKEEDLIKVVKEPWLDRLRLALKTLPRYTNVFVEIPYGLQPDKRMWRFIGGKIIYIGCKREEILIERMKARGTPELIPFIKRIPNLEQSERIAKSYGLSLININTNCSLEELTGKVNKFNSKLSQGGELNEISRM